ncbi:hypothetical protein [Aggregatibacter actinomycetemcomitans]|uniref:hypothetical protein n=1 Tax=Aggregatibacter actinomycetemcomitans TaxID=714 RepID=UPI00197B5AA1|nr:hypothetical protein [Aggregatibacter actinomycetemcomitans]
MHDTRLTLNYHRSATPWDNTVQGAEPKSESNSKPSSKPITIKESTNTPNETGSNDQRDLADQFVCGRTCGFFINT